MKRCIRYLPVVLLAGCSGPVASEVKALSPAYVHDQSQPKNLIDRALAGCPDKTETAETTCVKQAIADAHLDAAGLVKIVPGCRVGQVCHQEFTTEDRLGYVSYTSAVYSVHWRVDFDLRHATRTADSVPITVKQASASR